VKNIIFFFVSLVWLISLLYNKMDLESLIAGGNECGQSTLAHQLHYEIVMLEI
jgi:hypothetical protein